MKTRHYFLLIALLLAAHLTGCRASKPPESDPPDSSSVGNSHFAPLAYAPAKEAFTTKPLTKPLTLDRLPAKLGFFLSTPAGSARRQNRKDARAAVPKKIGKGAVYAPKATEVVNAFKPRAAVINADTGAVVTAIGKNKASAATAPGATATTTTSKGLSWLWLLVPAAGLAFWLYRKTIPFV